MSTETDARLLIVLRCVLAFSLFAIVASPSVSASLSVWIYGPLTVYCAYSLIITVVWYQRDWQIMPRALHWIDVLFYSYLIAASGTTEGYFFLFFFYPIMVSSFSWGFREGVMVTLVSTVLFSTFGLIEGQSEYSRVMIPASGLLLFGYVISYLGVYEQLLRSRLALLKELNNPWNPRFGVDHVHAANLDLLLKFYNASSCVLVLQAPPLNAALRDVYGHQRQARREVFAEGSSGRRCPSPVAAAGYPGCLLSRPRRPVVAALPRLLRI